MNDTRNEIIRIGNELVRSVGYNAFSYADIAKALNTSIENINVKATTEEGLGFTGCTGRSGRSHHGSTRYPAIDAGLRRIGTGTDDCAIHRNGQLRNRLQRDGRRSHRVDHRQSNGKRNGKIKQTWFAYTA